MKIVFVVIIAVVAAIVAALVTYFAARTRLVRAESELNAAKERIEEEKMRVQEAKEEGKKRLEEDRERQKEVLEATKLALQAENDKTLKAREESLKKEAEQTIRNVTAGLDQNIKQMSEAFEAQKKSHAEEIASIKTQFEETAKNLGAQSEKIGVRAEKLADALRHDNKMQGNWGEMQLQNIFDQEGLVKGRDYEREEYLRDEKDELLLNEDSGKRMRPDFILHFPDNTDVVVDSKMNIDAYVDWYNAEDDEEKEAAKKRNLEAVKAQVKSLKGKRYNEYIGKGRKALPYVIMYVSNYGALALAKQLEPNIVNDAFRDNVLVTTEETIMPFLRLVRTAWVNNDQVKNVEQIVVQAQYMVERTADLCKAVADVRRSLEDALTAQGKCEAQLMDSGKSLRHAALETVKLGVKMNPSKRKHLEIEENTIEI